MIRTKCRVFLSSFTIVCAVILGACSSAPVTLSHYVLNTASQHDLSAANQAPIVEIKRIVLPDYLQGRSLVMQRLDGTLAMASKHVWAQPLAEDIGATLARKITQNGNYSAVYTGAVSHKISSQLASVEVHIEHFLPTESGDLILTGYWYNRASEDLTNTLHRFHFQSSLSADGYAYAVGEMRVLIAELANDIQRVLLAHNAQGDIH